MPEARLQRTREAYRMTFKGVPLYFDHERCVCGAILPLNQPHAPECYRLRQSAIDEPTAETPWAV